MADAVAYPTKPYTDMTFGMGKDRCPAVCMTQYAAKMYCKWLCGQDGPLLPAADRGRMGVCLPGRDHHRLLVRRRSREARASTPVYADNSNDKYAQGRHRRSPIPGASTTCTATSPNGSSTSTSADTYKKAATARRSSARGASRPRNTPAWSAAGAGTTTSAEALRSAARRGSSKDWKQQDPQIPQSIWYMTDAQFVGFRVVRPLRMPTEEEAKAFEPDPRDPAGVQEGPRRQDLIFKRLPMLPKS